MVQEEEAGVAMRLVMIEWLDSYGSSGWQDVSDLGGRSLLCRSVGWLVKDSDQCKVVAPHLTDAGHDEAPPQANGVMTIPTRAVVRVYDLDSPATSSSCSSESGRTPPPT